MSNQSDMTLKEEQRIKTRMFKALGGTGKREEFYFCNGVACHECPLCSINTKSKYKCFELPKYDIDKYTKILRDWNEAHPPKTNLNVLKEKIQGMSAEEIYEELNSYVYRECALCIPTNDNLLKGTRSTQSQFIAWLNAEVEG